MANKVLLKKSSVGARVPTTSDLDYGELALNYADGKLYYKTSSNTIKSFTEDTSVVTLTGTQTLSNKTLSAPSITGNITGDVVATGYLKSLNSSGDEGGEILLAKPQTNTALSGTGVTIDVYQNKIRFFEQGGSARGAYIDITACSGGATSNLLTGGGSSGYSDLVEIAQTGISTSTTLYSASATTYRGAKYTIQITNSTAYAMYEFLVMHDGTGIYFPYSSGAYAADASGNYQNYFHGDYLDSIAITKIQVGNTYHALNWAVSAGNLVFSASCSSGTIDIKGTALLIKA